MRQDLDKDAPFSRSCPEPFLGFSGGSWAQWVGVLPGPMTGSPIWHRPRPCWRARWCQRVEMPLCSLYMICKYTVGYMKQVWSIVNL